MITRIEIEERKPLPQKAGAPDYELLLGRFHGELAPYDPRNAMITDIAAAPVNAAGRVAYSATFAIAKPVDMTQASGVAFYDVPNRGMGWMRIGTDGNFQLNQTEADPDGHIRIISGWQGDIAPLPQFQSATVPVATGLKGRVMVHLPDMARGAHSVSLAEGLGLLMPPSPPASLDTAHAQLLRIEADDAPPVPVPSSEWAFGDCASTPFPGNPDPKKVCLRGGFDPDYAYFVVYEAADPKVLGVGFAATRDFVSFLRHGGENGPGAANPLSGKIRWMLATGQSQSGNFLRSFVHLGFNADDAGLIVFDGMNVNIAARQVPLNVRFGHPGGAAGLYEIGSEGTVWWSSYEDRVRGRGTTSLLDRCTASGTCPLIIETFGSAEIWGLRMTPDLVGTNARADIPLPANVRRYYLPGVNHGGSLISGFSVTGAPAFPGAPKSVLAGNPNPTVETMNVIPKLLVGWVRDKIPPPPSSYPTLAAGDLVEPTTKAMGWPSIPGAPVPDGKINAFVEYKLGDGFNTDDMSGVVEHLPPKLGRTFPSLVPRVNADGNEMAGIPSVQHLVPLGTYTGWNERAEGYGKGRGSGMFGGFIPFAKTRAERLAKNDPRPSLEERYGSHDGFVAQVRKVVAERLAEGWLLPEDADKLVEQAEASDVL